MPSYIEVRGARANNLRSIDCDIPREQLVVVTGPSGSGKSSLVFDTIHAESVRRYEVVRQSHRAGRRGVSLVDRVSGLSFAVALQTRYAFPRKASLATITGAYELLRVLYNGFAARHCTECGSMLRSHSRREMMEVLQRVPQGAELTVLAPLDSAQRGGWLERFHDLAEQGYVRALIDNRIKRIEELTESDVMGDGVPSVVIDRFTVATERMSRLADALSLALTVGEGRVGILRSDLTQESERQLNFSERLQCDRCGAMQRPVSGADFNYKEAAITLEEYGFRAEILALTFKGKCFRDLLFNPVGELKEWIGTLPLDEAVSPALRQHLAQIVRVVELILDLGLGYLSLSRPASTLSTGELQRAQIVRALSREVLGAIYLLDEPSSGLHPLDIQKMEQALIQLRDRGNSVIIVEHDQQLIDRADFVLALGRGGGKYGGELIASGSPTTVAKEHTSPIRTRTVLSKSPSILQNAVRVVVRGARKHNLQDLSVSFPLGAIVAVAGVSGSGKSSLVTETLLPALHGVVSNRSALSADQLSPLSLEALEGWEGLRAVVDASQLPFAQHLRSTVATASGVHAILRKLYALTPDAKIRGYSDRTFSFNDDAGWCSTCRGLGVVRDQKHRGPRSLELCPRCLGRRYREELEQIRYRGRSVTAALDLTVEECKQEFRQVSRVLRICALLSEVGLGYLKLSEGTRSLSSGERQRLRLVRALATGEARDTVYVFDEPSRGSSQSELELLLSLFRRLQEEGATVIFVEHNPFLIRSADYVIELGPGAAQEGGRVIAEGPPTEVMHSSRTVIGPFLRNNTM